MRTTASIFLDRSSPASRRLLLSPETRSSVARRACTHAHTRVAGVCVRVSVCLLPACQPVLKPLCEWSHAHTLNKHRDLALTIHGHGCKDVVALGGHLCGAIGIVACVVVGERHELLSHPSDTSALMCGQRRMTQCAAPAAPHGRASPQPGGAAHRLGSVCAAQGLGSVCAAAACWPLTMRRWALPHGVRCSPGPTLNDLPSQLEHHCVGNSQSPMIFLFFLQLSGADGGAP